MTVPVCISFQISPFPSIYKMVSMYPKRGAATLFFRLPVSMLLRTARYVCSLLTRFVQVMFVYDRDIIRRLAACQPHRNFTSAGFSASRLRKYHDPLCLSSPPREQPDFRGYQYSRSLSFRAGHGVPTALARPVTVGIGNVPDEWVFNCLWHPLLFGSGRFAKGFENLFQQNQILPEKGFG